MRAALGTELVLIGMSAPGTQPGGDSASVDAVLARVGLPRFVLDLRPARTEPAIAAALASPRALRTNADTFVMLSPGAAFDALFFVDALTPPRAASP